MLVGTLTLASSGVSGSSKVLLGWAVQFATSAARPSVGGSTVGGHRLSSKLLGARHLCGSVLASDVRVLDAVSGGFERRLGRPREEPPTFALVSAIASGFFGVKSTCLQVTADAGSNKSVASAGSVRLDGSATVQNGAGSTTYAWSRVSGTGGSLSSAFSGVADVHGADVGRRRGEPGNHLALDRDQQRRQRHRRRLGDGDCAGSDCSWNTGIVERLADAGVGGSKRSGHREVDCADQRRDADGICA